MSFDKDFSGLITLTDHAKSLPRDSNYSQYLAALKKLITLFNRKYPLLKAQWEDNVLKVVIASQIPDIVPQALQIEGIQSVGPTSKKQVPSDDANFKQTISDLKAQAFLTYQSDALHLTKARGGSVIDIDGSDTVKKLLTHYANQDQKNIDLEPHIAAFGISAKPTWSKVRKFLSKFNPYMGE